MTSRRPAMTSRRTTMTTTAMMMMMMAAAVAMLGHVAPASAFESGFVESVCTSMAPLHDSVAQGGGGGGYTVVASGTTFQDDIPITVTLTGTDAFVGFMLEARNVTEGILEGLSIQDTRAQIRRCPTTGSTVTHTSMIDKITISVTWTPTINSPDNVFFRATFVQSRSVYWVGLPSGMVTRLGKPSATVPSLVPERQLQVDNITYSPDITGCGFSKSCMRLPGPLRPVLRLMFLRGDDSGAGQRAGGGGDKRAGLRLPGARLLRRHLDGRRRHLPVHHSERPPHHRDVVQQRARYPILVLQPHPAGEHVQRVGTGRRRHAAVLLHPEPGGHRAQEGRPQEAVLPLLGARGDRRWRDRETRCAAHGLQVSHRSSRISGGGGRHALQQPRQGARRPDAGGVAEPVQRGRGARTLLQARVAQHEAAGREGLVPAAPRPHGARRAHHHHRLRHPLLLPPGMEREGPLGAGLHRHVPGLDATHHGGLQASPQHPDEAAV
ncbi:uncharacterized protein LOC116957432 isoform X2 [Petromyzon marinus]